MAVAGVDPGGSDRREQDGEERSALSRVLIETKEEDHGWDHHDSASDPGQSGGEPGHHSDYNADDDPQNRIDHPASDHRFARQDHPQSGDEQDNSEDETEGIAQETIHEMGPEGRTDQTPDTERDPHLPIKIARDRECDRAREGDKENGS